MHTPELDDLIAWLGDLVRRVDSSLIDEWEELTHPDDDRGPSDLPPPTTGPNLRACRVQVRNHMFALISAISRRDWPTLYRRHPDVAWSEELAEYFDEYSELNAGPDARSPTLFTLDEDDDVWRVRQTFDDPQGDRGWSLTADVEIATDPDADESDRVQILDVEIHSG